MTTATKIPDTTPISEIVSAPRAIKHLEAAGFNTLGDVRARGMEPVFKLRYVGQVSIEEIQRAIGPQDKPEPKPAADDSAAEFDEGSHPIHLERTPVGPAKISWSPSRKVESPGGGFQLQAPLWIEFDERTGRATVTQRMYWMRFFNRDVARVNAAIEEGRPWRQACADMLRRDFRSHGHGFIVLTD
jgi:hypothetical protein